MLTHIAPHICYGCGEVCDIICERCAFDISDEDFGRCLWCVRPTAGQHQCASCARKYGVAGAWAVGVRDGVLKDVVDDYKFEARRGGARTLARLLGAAVPVLPSGALITYVPTSPAHIRERGFDHAAYLARQFASLRNLKCVPLLSRRSSGSQHELGRSAREKAAASAFALRRTQIEAPVLLIDDILTTGATLRACVKLLRQVGAPEVYVAVLARQMPH